MNKNTYKKFITMFTKAVKKSKSEALFTILKYDYTYSDIKYILKNVKKINASYYKKAFGNLLPKKYSDLMGNHSTFLRKNNLEKEIIWQAIMIEEFHNEINKFLRYKSEFEKKLLYGEYNDAIKILDQVESNICVSLWSIENRLIIEDLSNGIEANKNEFSRIASFEDNNLLKAIIQLISTRVEDSMSTNRYKNFINKLIDSNTDMDVFLSYILDYPSLIDNDLDLQTILFIESSNSIIDVYLAFINILTILNIKNIDEHNLKNSINYKIITNLVDVINDPRLEKIIYIFNPQKPIKPFYRYDEFIKICDTYTIGDYQNTVKLIRNSILEDSNSVQVYEIYILSCIYGEIEFENIHPKESLGYRILNDMYNILIKSTELQNYISDITKVMRILGNNELALQIYEFINKYCMAISNPLISKICEVSSYYLTPRFIKVYDNKEYKDNFLDELRNYIGNSETIDFYKDVLYKKNLSSKGYDLLRKKLYSANELLQDGDYCGAINSYLEIINNKLIIVNTPKYNYVFEKILIKLYESYIRSCKIEEAIELIVTNYLRNVGYTYRIDKTPIINILNEIDNINYNNISIPLLYYINNPRDKGSIFAAYDNYLFSLNIQKPSQIREYMDSEDKNKVIMFLNNICTLDIMEDSFFFENAEELEGERILVCQLLIELDELNSESYMKEIKQITEKIMIRKGIKRVDESKIFVDIDKIKDCLKDNIEEMFNKYIEISKMKKIYIEYEVLSLKDISKNIEYVNIVPGNLNLFKEMFLEIRDYFISSNEYGLDSYLSTRIRHGTLLGQLRKTFEINKLITSKDTKEGNQYDDNEYWLQKLTFFKEEEKEKFNSILREFSETIDEKITEVTSVWIKIKTSDSEVEKDRLFDYRITKADYDEYYKKLCNITDYEEFINKVLEILFDITNRNLENVRKKITVTLNDTLINILNSLENNLKSIRYGSGSEEKELYKNIAMCRTEIQHEIENISKWFYLSKNLDDNIYTFKELFDISKEILKSSYPKFSLINFVDTNVNVLKNIKGNEYAYYIDILLILFSNILQRSNLEPDQINVKIDAYEEHDNIVIKIVNNHNNDEKIIQEKIEESLEKINNVDMYSEFSRQEGGTGFVKVEKMLKYNLRINHKIELYGNGEIFEVKIKFKLNGEKI
ncbi:hypothetical protein ACQPV1_20630 [Clostridium neonatale]